MSSSSVTDVSEKSSSLQQKVSILFIFQVGLSYKNVAEVQVRTKQLERVYENVCLCPDASLESLDIDSGLMLYVIINQ